MTPENPAWVDVVSAMLVINGALAALIGALGLVRLETFFQRIHAPTLGNTIGVWSLVGAIVLQLSFQLRQPYLHVVLITVFLAMSAPVTTLFLMRAAVFRRRAQALKTGVPDPELLPGEEH